MDRPAWLDIAAYPFAPNHVALPDGRLHYVDEGTGEPIVLVHGTPTWSFDWRHLIRALAPRARCVALDHLGFGLSDRPRGADYSPEAHARRFTAFVDALGLDRFTLVVHDFGGPIALPTALAAPERVRRLVVLSSWMWPLDDDPRMARMARMAGGRLFHWMYRYLNFSLRVITPSAYGDRRVLAPIHRQLLAPFRDRWARDEVLWALARALAGSRAHYAALWDGRAALAGIPALVVWGMKDRALGPELLPRWAEVLPRAEVVRLAAAGHWPQEEAPGEVLAALTSLLDRA